MCSETMDIKSKQNKTACLRKAMKPGSTLRWKPLRVSTEEEDEASRRCRASTVKATHRKCLRREQRRAQLAKLSHILGDMGKNETRKRESMYEACVYRHPPGAMAPENTTQYLMTNVYEDMKTNDIQTLPVSGEPSSHLYADCLSPSGVYRALDSDYETCLAFQQRDFEDLYGLC